VRHANECREEDDGKLSPLMADDGDAWVKSGVGRRWRTRGRGGRRRRCCALLPSERGEGWGKKTVKMGASGDSFLSGGERKGGVAGIARCHMERGSGGGPRCSLGWRQPIGNGPEPVGAGCAAMSRGRSEQGRGREADRWGPDTVEGGGG
jgi:hypothetical protein